MSRDGPDGSVDPSSSAAAAEHAGGLAAQQFREQNRTTRISDDP